MDPERLKPIANEGQEQEVSPELIERVEKSGLSRENKVNVLLVAGGLKPASSVSFDVKISGAGMETKVFASNKEAKDIGNLVESSGLFYRKRDDPEFRYFEPQVDGSEKPYDMEHISYFISGTQERLESLVGACDKGDHQLIGQAYGFAPSAIEAWMGKREKLDGAQLPEEIRECEAYKFAPGVLSADNWQEELKYYQAWADYIKKVSPALYNQVMGIIPETK